MARPHPCRGILRRSADWSRAHVLRRRGHRHRRCGDLHGVTGVAFRHIGVVPLVRTQPARAEGDAANRSLDGVRLDRRHVHAGVLARLAHAGRNHAARRRVVDCRTRHRAESNVEGAQVFFVALSRAWLGGARSRAVGLRANGWCDSRALRVGWRDIHHRRGDVLPPRAATSSGGVRFPRSVARDDGGGRGVPVRGDRTTRSLTAQVASFHHGSLAEVRNCISLVPARFGMRLGTRLASFGDASRWLGSPKSETFQHLSNHR